MTSRRFTRHCALFAGGAAIIAMGTLTACSKSSEEAPSTSSATSSPSATPTEKSVNGGNKSFSPTVKPALPPNSGN